MLKATHYLGDSKISSAERSRLMSEPAIELTSADIGRMAQQAVERHAEFSAWIAPHMTVLRAERIRHLRCIENCSYRALAGLCALEWGYCGEDVGWYPLTNQLAGVALCEAAARLLNENMQAYPWQGNQA